MAGETQVFLLRKSEIQLIVRSMRSLPHSICILLLFAISMANAEERPNILWISTEDHGPHLGCYGDDYATTPQLDRFAESSLRYTRASSNAPVCAPARTSIITGMYAPSLGAQHMRSKAAIPDWLRLFPSYLQDAGYYTTNNAKEDYNLVVDDAGWSDSSKTAHWKNRAEGQPFFAVFNIFATHESQIRNHNESPTHDPANAPLPPYHPDTPETRKDWAQYYDRLQKMDTQFGRLLAELEDAGLRENTIVIFWADHGSGMPRSKRYPGWSGLHVPFMVHVPERFKDLAPDEYAEGSTSDRLIGLIDLAPTVLSIAKIEPPAYHQGRAFMGHYKQTGADYSFGFRGRMDERPDFCRSVTDGRYIYIRNFYPHLPHGQFIDYQQQTGTTRVWYQLFKDGKLNDLQSAFWKPHPPEELFDLSSDPFETQNLAASQPEIAARMGKVLAEQMVKTRDSGIIPETILEKIREERSSLLIVDMMRAMDETIYRELLSTLESQLSDEASFKLDEVAGVGTAYWRYIEILQKGGQLFAENEDWIAKNLDTLPDASAIPAAEAIAIHTDSEVNREAAVERLVKLSDPAENPLIMAIHAFNALDHLREQDLLDPASAKTLSIKSANIPDWANSYLPSLLERFQK